MKKLLEFIWKIQIRIGIGMLLLQKTIKIDNYILSKDQLLVIKNKPSDEVTITKHWTKFSIKVK